MAKEGFGVLGCRTCGIRMACSHFSSSYCCSSSKIDFRQVIPTRSMLSPEILAHIAMAAGFPEAQRMGLTAKQFWPPREADVKAGATQLFFSSHHSHLERTSSMYADSTQIVRPHVICPGCELRPKRESRSCHCNLCSHCMKFFLCPVCNQQRKNHNTGVCRILIKC